MFSSMWNFVKRHRRKFFVTTAVVGGGILLGKYTLKKLKEWEEKEVIECCELLRRDSHFENTQKTCEKTVLSLITNLKDSIVVLLDSDALTSVLKMKPVNKVQVWEQLKLVAFSRAVTAIYGSSVLIALLHVQMNILGGYLYVDVVYGGKGSEPRNFQVSQEVQQKFLDAVQHLLNDGLKTFVDSLQVSVKKVVELVSLKDKLTLADMDRIFRQIRVEFEVDETNPLHDMSSFLLPSVENGEICDGVTLGKILNETRDVINSEDFQRVFMVTVDTGYTHLSDWLAGFFVDCGKRDGGVSFVNPHAVAVPLAKIIPALNNLVFNQCSVQPGQLPQMLLQLETVKLFAGNIYEAFSQPHDEGLQNSDKLVNE